MQGRGTVYRDTPEGSVIETTPGGTSRRVNSGRAADLAYASVTGADAVVAATDTIAWIQLLQTVTLNIWETAGQERFHALTELFFVVTGVHS